MAQSASLKRLSLRVSADQCHPLICVEWEATKQPGAPPRLPMPPSGFGGLSRRRGRKPIIAAVNGLALGGGCEIVTNCDMVFASPGAVFALPEVKIGVAAIAGALPRLVRVIGRMRAMEMALTGRNVGAEEALRWGLCNAVAEKDGRTGVGGSVVELAVRYAEIIATHSPDSVVVSKEGIELGWDGISVEEATDRLSNGIWKGLEEGDNVKEGLRAFVEKRPPIWVPSKL